MPAVVAPSVLASGADGGTGISGFLTSKKMADIVGFVEGCADGREEEESRIKWLASQIIGADAEFSSPFGCRRITYCDHTASGRFLRFIEEFLMAEVLPFYGNTHTEDSYVGLHTGELVKQANQYIKHCLGAGPHDVLLFCGSGSTAAIKRLQEVMGIAAPPPLRRRILESLPSDEHWVVFLGPYEHHSNLLSWRESLAEVVEIGLDNKGNLDISSLEAALQSPEFAGRPKLGSFSACSNVTGVHTDTRAVASLLHSHGAYACFDFACSGPYEEIDMRSGEEDGYDAVFLSPHKFLGGPGSPGILLMSDDLYRLKGRPPSTSGGGTVLYVNGFNEEDTMYCENPEEREDAGTPAIVQKIRAALAFAVKSYAGKELIARREAALRQRAAARLSANPRIRVLGENNGDNQPIFSFVVYPGGDSDGKILHCHFISRLLNDLFGIQARGGCACAGPYGHLLLGVSRKQSLAVRDAISKGYMGLKPGFTRVSFTYYTSPDEVEFVLKAIEFIADYGHRFLHLYDFDWKTGAWNFNGGAAERSPVPQRRSSQESAPPPYEDYLREAREIATALPERVARRRPPPEDVDQQLITFLV